MNLNHQVWVCSILDTRLWCIRLECTPHVVLTFVFTFRINIMVVPWESRRHLQGVFHTLLLHNLWICLPEAGYLSRVGQARLQLACVCLVLGNEGFLDLSFTGCNVSSVLSLIFSVSLIWSPLSNDVFLYSQCPSTPTNYSVLQSGYALY